jgi:hypothetical protein
MRLMLASLWAMCGDWREAQVDLRAAWFLDNSLAWAGELAERDKPPANIFLVLGGPGPEPKWNPEMTVNPLRSERQVNFKMRGRKSSLTIADQRGAIVEAHLSPDAGKWYGRHLARENELHELIMDSTYGGKAAARGVLAGTKIAATTSVGVLLGIGGTALGAAVIYYGHGSGDAVKLGAAIAAVSIGKGAEISRKGYEESSAALKQELDPSTSYRFVRYLPEYLWLGWSDRPIAYPVKLRTSQSTTVIQDPGVRNGVRLSVAHVPDVMQPCLYKIGNGSITVESQPNAAGNCPASVDW